MRTLEEGGSTAPGSSITSRAIGQKIKGFRLIRGLDLAKVSAETGIPVEALALYERGTRVPGGVRMLLIMDALQITPADLLRTEAGS